MTTDGRRVVASAVISRLNEADHTIDWLADRTRLTHAALQEKLSARDDFTVTDLAEIAEALGIPPSALVPPEQ